MDNNIIIYVDGSGVRGPGGWGFTAQKDGKVTNLAGAETNATNNRMELMAPIMALNYFKPGTPILICSDSEYVIKGITTWIFSWISQNLLPDPRYVKHYLCEPGYMTNADLWFELLRATEKHNVSWKWVPGHSGVEGNEKADRLAVEAMADLRAEAAKNLALDTLGLILPELDMKIKIVPASDSHGEPTPAVLAEYVIQFNNVGAFKGMVLTTGYEPGPFTLSIQGAPDRNYKLIFNPTVTENLNGELKGILEKLAAHCKTKQIELTCRGVKEKDRKFYTSLGLSPVGKSGKSFKYKPI